MRKRTNGTVKFFMDAKGHGFIVNDKNQDVFIHYSQIDLGIDGHKTLISGQIVQYLEQMTDKGLAATDLYTTANEKFDLDMADSRGNR